VTDEELIKEMMMLLMMRIADDQGSLDLNEAMCHKWIHHANETIFMSAKRLGIQLNHIQ